MNALLLAVVGVFTNPLLLASWFLIVAAVIGGAMLLARSVRRSPKAVGTSTAERFAKKARLIRSRFTPARQFLAVAGIGVGILMFSLTGWPILLFMVPGAALWIPVLLGGDVEKETATKLEALEAWTRSLSSLTVAGATLEQTLAVSAANAAPVIAPAVRKMASRLKAKWSTSAALVSFAQEVGDPASDVIVAHLLLAEKTRGTGLSNALDDLAEIMADEVRVRRSIFAERAKPRQNAKSIILITLALIAFVPFAGSFTASYGTVLGQIILTFWLGIYVALLIWLGKIMAVRPAPRFLNTTSSRRNK